MPVPVAVAAGGQGEAGNRSVVLCSEAVQDRGDVHCLQRQMQEHHDKFVKMYVFNRLLGIAVEIRRSSDQK